MRSVTDRPTDIPPWSALAERARGLSEPASPTGPTGAAPPDPEHRRPGRKLPVTLAVLAVAAMSTTVVILLLGRGTGPAAGSFDRLDLRVPELRDAAPPTSADHPAAPGTRVAIGNGWTVMVHGWDPAATATLAPLNPELSPTDEQTIVLIDLEMTYLDGERSAESPFYGVDLGVVGSDGRVVTPADTPCVSNDPAFDMQEPMAQGSSRRGGICFLVATAQIDSLKLTAAPSMAPRADTSWLELG